MILTVSGEGDWDFRITDLVKTLMELIFNPCGEFRRAQLPKSTLLTYMFVPLRYFLDLLTYVQMLKREWVRKAMGIYRTYSIPDKTAAFVPEFAVEDLPSVGRTAA